MKFSQRLVIGYIQTKFKLLSAVSKRRAAEQAFILFGTPFFKPKKNLLPKNAETLQFELDIPLAGLSRPGKKNPLTIRGYRWNHPRPVKVLILHGFSSVASKFEHYVHPLVKKGYEVLAFDAPAHGSSDGKNTNAVEYCAMIAKVIELFGPIERFIAHSFGGIAVSLALEKIHHDAGTRLVLIAPATETTTAVDAAFRMLKIKDTEVRKMFDRVIIEIGGKETSWYSIRRAMHKISATVLWIHDEDDDITPLQDALTVQEDNHPNVRFLITKGLGHQRIYRDPEIKKRVVEFL
jgi:pimeloyl-ACP methyl ester carboxylesterase